MCSLTPPHSPPHFTYLFETHINKIPSSKCKLFYPSSATWESEKPLLQASTMGQGTPPTLPLKSIRRGHLPLCRMGLNTPQNPTALLSMTFNNSSNKSLPLKDTLPPCPLEPQTVRRLKPVLNSQWLPSSLKNTPQIPTKMHACQKQLKEGFKGTIHASRGKELKPEVALCPHLRRCKSERAAVFQGPPTPIPTLQPNTSHTLTHFPC